MKHKQSRRQSKTLSRQPLIESLEDRRMLSADWRNPADNFDVNADQRITPLDALQVINEFKRRSATEGGSQLSDAYPPGQPYVDVDGSGTVSALDALLVVNHLRRFGLESRKLIETDSFSNQVSTMVTVDQSTGQRTLAMVVEYSFGPNGSTALSEDLFSVYVIGTESSNSVIGSSDAGR